MVESRIFRNPGREGIVNLLREFSEHATPGLDNTQLGHPIALVACVTNSIKMRGLRISR